VSFALAARLLAGERGIEMTPDQLEALVYGWLAEYRVAHPEVAGEDDIMVFNRFIEQYRNLKGS
jgi:hypothetical protein